MSQDRKVPWPKRLSAKQLIPKRLKPNRQDQNDLNRIGRTEKSPTPIFQYVINLQISSSQDTVMTSGRDAFRRGLDNFLCIAAVDCWLREYIFLVLAILRRDSFKWVLQFLKVCVLADPKCRTLKNERSEKNKKIH